MMITRKLFLCQLAGGGLGLMLEACGGGGGDSAPIATDSSTCNHFTFSANHGHELELTSADLDSTTAMTFSVQGTANHDHPVTLTPAQLASLKAGQAISMPTPPYIDGHFHDLSGTCA